MATLLRHHIESLRLRDDAPFPSEVEDGERAAMELRRAIRCKKFDPALCAELCDCQIDDDPIDNDRYEGD